MMLSCLVYVKHDGCDPAGYGSMDYPPILIDWVIHLTWLYFVVIENEGFVHLHLNFLSCMCP